MRTGAEAAAIAVSLVGTPFAHLPGEPAQHSIVGRSSDGTRITVEQVEMVMNDAWSIDSCHGVGTYAALDTGSDPENIRQREALALAVELYGCQPIDLHKTGAN